MASSGSNDWKPVAWQCSCERWNKKNVDYCGKCGAHWQGNVIAYDIPGQVNWNYGGHQGKGQNAPGSPRSRRALTPRQTSKKPKERVKPKGAGKPSYPHGGKGAGKGFQEPLPPPPPIPAPLQGKGPAPPDASWPLLNANTPAPAVPPPAQATMDPQMKMLMAQLKRCSDSLPSETQQLLADINKKSDQRDTKELHHAVNKLGQAKKQLATLRLSRWQLHSCWTNFLQEATVNWQRYTQDFSTQDQELVTKITGAKEQLAQAKAYLVATKDKATENVEEAADASDEEMLREDTGRDIAEGLQQMHASLQTLKQKADSVLMEEENAAKRAKLAQAAAEPIEVPEGDAVAHPGATGESLTSPSMVPFAMAGK